MTARHHHNKIKKREGSRSSLSLLFADCIELCPYGTIEATPTLRFPLTGVTEVALALVGVDVVVSEDGTALSAM